MRILQSADYNGTTINGAHWKTFQCGLHKLQLESE
jgi:hypothetical protein